jgi:uncharacterized membrane protein (UPF0127 family)
VLLAVAGAVALVVPALGRKVAASTCAAGGSGSTRRTPLAGFNTVEVHITDASGRAHDLCMLAASTSRQQDRGLMQVTDRTLGGYAGMLFAFTQDVSGPFWMRNTPMPLSIAFIDRSGRTVSVADMAPCGAIGDCPYTYAAGPFRWAVEVPQGRLAGIGLGRGSVLRVVGT